LFLDPFSLIDGQGSSVGWPLLGDNPPQYLQSQSSWVHSENFTATDVDECCCGASIISIRCTWIYWSRNKGNGRSIWFYMHCAFETLYTILIIPIPGKIGIRVPNTSLLECSSVSHIQLLLCSSISILFLLDKAE
jgi:hypothetical protein